MTDLIKSVTQNLPDLTFELPLSLQQYEFCNRWLAKDRVDLRGGESIRRHVQLDSNGAAKFVRPYETMTANVAQLMSRIDLDWVYMTTDWSLERSEILRNRTGEGDKSFSRQTYDLAKSREVDAMISLCNLAETSAWQVPAVDRDNLTWLGIPYWVPKLAAGQAATAAGFYGGMYSTDFTAVGGIIPATSGSNTTAIAGGKTLWRSYQAGYTLINDAWAKQMSKAWYSINFKAPTQAADLMPGSPISNFRLYCNQPTLVDIEEYMRKQNDNIGSDVGKYLTETSFKRQPFIYIPVLDTTAGGGQYNPIYMLNHAYWKVFGLQGDYLTRTEPMNSTSQPWVWTTFTRLGSALCCTNRRAQACINQVA
jgi:hypothetical protein